MSGYPKIWTSIMDEDWWKLANGIQRGCYLQLLLLCKSGADSGHLCYKNVIELSVLFAIDRRTTNKVLTFLSQNCCINVTYEDGGLLRIKVPKYKFYQGLDAKAHAKHMASKSAVSPPKSVLPNQTILEPDQTIPPPAKKPPKKTNPDHSKVTDYFCQAYEKKVGVKYGFHGKEDGRKIKTLLGRWNLPQIKHLIDTMFASTDEFYRTGGGYSLGVLLANDNKLVQEAKRVHDGTNQLNEAGAKTAAAMERVLKEMECPKQNNLPLLEE